MRKKTLQYNEKKIKGPGGYPWKSRNQIQIAPENYRPIQRFAFLYPEKIRRFKTHNS